MFAYPVEQGYLPAALLAALSEGVVAVDGRGAVAYANPAGAALLGERSEGGPFLECVHPEDIPLVREALEAVRGGDRALAFRLAPARGRVRWVEAHIRPAPPALPSGLLLTLRSEIPPRQLQEIFDGAMLALHWTSPDGTLLWANRAELALLGHPAADYLGRNVADFHADPAEAAEVRRRLAAGEGLRDFEARLVARDGSLRHVLLNVEPRPPDNPRAWSCCLTVDVTLRKRAEEELGNSEALNRRIIESSRDGIQILDREGRLLSTSRAGQRLMGIQDPDELAGTPWPGLWRGGDRAKAEAAMAAALRQGAGKFQGVRHTAQGGSRWFDVLVTPILDPEGEPWRLLAVSRDITEQKDVEEALRRSEEQLRQSQKMEAIGRLAGGVAHDFNNLLTAIAGYSDLLLRTLPGEDSARAHVEEIRKAGERAAALTRQLLTFGRKTAAAARPFDPAQVVEGMRRMLARLIGEDVELATALRPGLRRAVADPGQVEQVILNLAVNARDAMPRGGRLLIEAADADLGPSLAGAYLPIHPGPHVRLTVSDTGVGMDAEVKAHLFEPFFTTKAPGQGTGLGLSMVYGMVRQAGGNLTVASEPGKGTAVSVYLPALPAAPKETEPGTTRIPVSTLAAPAPAPARQALETVLLVEDEDVVRRLVSQVLASQGYRVLEAASGAEALAVSERHSETVDLLLTDVVMTGMSGREVAERLVAARPGLKVIYMSGYTEDAVLRHGVFQNSMAFLGKPFSPQALVQKLREVLDGRKEASKEKSATGG